MDDCAIVSFLEPIGLMQYLETFQTKGYDRESDFCRLTDTSLDDLEITDIDHRNALLHGAEQYVQSDQYKVYQFLKDNDLEYYYKHFISSEYTTIESLSRIDVNRETLDDLEITLPGHKRRLENAKFMVDSGSDVVTARQEVLDQLDLELIGSIESKGVHATVEKQLYKAVLGIGQIDISIEVMAQSYDSIGNRVLRHFRHFIDSKRHIWLKGDKLDTSSPFPIGASLSSSRSAGPSTSAKEMSEELIPPLSREESTMSTTQASESTKEHKQSQQKN
uniref:Uncharacterized protein LOC100377597 n=1 Tax=Saccoglossus kowalevskii TaxID=10224 RepID=A0ABM0H0M0_SACKO|nr:PREDICTED: uncharacterized protein LOC100377597 [Saccoglossus kowalevskii]